MLECPTHSVKDLIRRYSWVLCKSLKILDKWESSKTPLKLSLEAFSRFMSFAKFFVAAWNIHICVISVNLKNRMVDKKWTVSSPIRASII